MKSTFLLVTSILILTSCAHTNANKNSEELMCQSGRTPNSVGKCSELFEINQKKTQLEILGDLANKATSGLQQTTFTSSTGEVLRQGPKEVVADKNQIVSLFSQHGGTMIQGTPTEIIFDTSGKPAYLIFANQPVRLLEHSSYLGKKSTSIISGQNFNRHKQGFSTPVGLVKGLQIPLSEIPIAELRSTLQKMTDTNGVTKLEFESGVVVSGIIEGITENSFKKISTASVITFKNGTAKVTIGERVLYRPSWGPYDMVLGNTITDSNVDAGQPDYKIEEDSN